MIRRAAWKRRRRKKETSTYVAQILHYIIELFSILILIANLLNGFLTDKVFCNLRPHSIFLRLLCFKTPSFVSSIDDGEFTDFFVFVALAATDTV